MRDNLHSNPKIFFSLTNPALCSETIMSNLILLIIMIMMIIIIIMWSLILLLRNTTIIANIIWQISLIIILWYVLGLKSVFGSHCYCLTSNVCLVCFLPGLFPVFGLEGVSRNRKRKNLITGEMANNNSFIFFNKGLESEADKTKITNRTIFFQSLHFLKQK